MNALTKIENTALATMSEQELMTVLQSSLYPGASPDSIRMVLGYCKAAGLDPLQKPVHIVPMWDKNTKTMRDVVMPGVGLYRTQAARSGQLAGISEPEFGPTISDNLGGTNVNYPEWARVTVSRLLPGGVIANFTAREFWLENYATAGKDTAAPNAMWRKRPAGQIAKCAQAQALRMAFPEMTGSQPTADEMEGKALDDSAVVIEREPKASPELMQAARDAALQGMEAYGKWWHGISKEDRQALKDEREGLRAVAAEADAARTVVEQTATEEPSQ